MLEFDAFSMFLTSVISEPVVLHGAGKYDLNVLKEIKVTDSYLGLPEKVTGCQNTQKLQDCEKKQYFDALHNECGCLPLSLRIEANNVVIHLDNFAVI